MNKAIKLVSILIMVVMLATALSTICYAEITPNSITATDPTEINTLTTKAGDILGYIRAIAAVISVIIIAILGIKYMIGSTEEKAEYKKSFIPLIIGMIVVLSATTIAKFIWDMAK